MTVFQRLLLVDKSFDTSYGYGKLKVVKLTINKTSMVKTQLIEVLAAKCGITSSESERVLNNLIGIIYETLKQDGEVQISGFGTFLVFHREARLGVNPRQPSQKITIPKLVTPKFRAGERFKQEIKK